ncbi:Protein MCM10 [Gossypium australe]|uniref:Protein MCM10 n=1 Tax=Gossypium australe TaxID=47621 RepID=A0A5B6V9X7_9ROSI|nr:Protein MCM10 [Gossypium australe]
MSSNQARAKSEDAESNAPASVQRVASSSRRPKSEGRSEEAKQAFFQMMNEWFTEYLRTNPAMQQPLPPAPQPVLDMPQGAKPVRTSKPHVDKIRKCGVEEFRAIADDDPERAEFWLENTIRVLDELSCTSAKCLKCAVSLLKDTTYHWWNTITSVVPRENIICEFFQTEFKKKYISQRFLDQKKKENLELKQGNMTVSEYKREFVQLSKYARAWVPTEADMCKHFEEGTKLVEHTKLWC